MQSHIWKLILFCLFRFCHSVPVIQFLFFSSIVLFIQFLSILSLIFLFIWFQLFHLYYLIYSVNIYSVSIYSLSIIPSIQRLLFYLLLYLFSFDYFFHIILSTHFLSIVSIHSVSIILPIILSIQFLLFSFYYPVSIILAFGNLFYSETLESRVPKVMFSAVELKIERPEQGNHYYFYHKERSRPQNRLPQWGTSGEEYVTVFTLSGGQ